MQYKDVILSGVRSTEGRMNGTKDRVQVFLNAILRCVNFRSTKIHSAQNDGKMQRVAAIMLAIFVLIPSMLRAQQPGNRTDYTLIDSQHDPAIPTLSKSTFGAFGDAAWNIHRANFQQLPGIPNCCPLFENGSGLGGSFGVFYDYDAFGDGHLGVRAGINLLDGKLIADEPVTLAINGQAVQGTIEHTISAQFTTLSLEPYYAFEAGALHLMIGPSVGLVTRSTYNQSEAITQPANQGVFSPEGTRTRNVYSGTIPQAASLRVGAVGGVSYWLPLNSDGTFHLIPEVLFDYGLTPLVSGLTWNVSPLQGGVSIGYTPMNVPPPPAPPPPPPPPPPKKPMLAASMKAYSIMPNGIKDSTNLSISVEEYYSTTLTPILPFVFFGRDDAAIPARYHAISPYATSTFQLKPTDTTTNITVYHDVLNIIGQRMKKFPQARITLTGCTSDEPEELADKTLAMSRAQSVAKYLETVWGVSPNRITLQARGLPAKPSSLTQEDGMQENRRVEIASNMDSILAPVFLPDTTLISDPPMMKFVPTVDAQAGVKHWELYVTSDVKIFHHDYGENIPKGWNWDLRAVSADIPRTEDSLEYGLIVDDSAGQELETTGTIPVHQVTIKKKREERRADTVIERYTLVLFDFGSAKIDPKNERAIAYIRQQITPGTMAYITGYADRTGEDTLDQRLTEDRANAVAAMLGTQNYVAKGVGKSKLLFDNNYPEGRFYSRTVNIVLNKPINAGNQP